MAELKDLITIDDVRAAACRALRRMLSDFVDGGADDEASKHPNSAGFATHALMARALSGRESRDHSRFAERARASGYKALTLTVDCPLRGPRECDVRNGFTINLNLGLSTTVDGPCIPSGGCGWRGQGARYGTCSFSLERG